MAENYHFSVCNLVFNLNKYNNSIFIAPIFTTLFWNKVPLCVMLEQRNFISGVLFVLSQEWLLSHGFCKWWWKRFHRSP